MPDHRIRHVFILLLCCIFMLMAPTPGLAQQAPAGASFRPVDRAQSTPGWHQDWDRPGWDSVAATSTLLTAALAINLHFDSVAVPNWQGPILADRWVHQTLGGSTPERIARAGAISDALLSSLILAPLLVEPTLGYAKTDNPVVAGRIALINMQSMALVFFVTSAIKFSIARQRPPLGDCWDDPLAHSGCADRETVSFPSGHTSMAFVGAALICLNHEVLDPLGAPWDSVACYGALSAATATGLLRIGAHQHYLSDVIVGAALGLTAGYLLPKLLYFDAGGPDDSPGEKTAPLTPPGAPPSLISLGTTW